MRFKWEPRLLIPGNSIPFENPYPEFTRPAEDNIHNIDWLLLGIWSSCSLRIMHKIHNCIEHIVNGLHRIKNHSVYPIFIVLEGFWCYITVGIVQVLNDFWNSQTNWIGLTVLQGCKVGGFYCRNNLLSEYFSTVWVSLNTRSVSEFCSFNVLVICSVVSGGITNGPGCDGVMKGTLERRAYCWWLSTSPKWPYAPPPRFDGTVLLFVFNSLWRVLMEWKVAVPRESS